MSTITDYQSRVEELEYKLEAKNANLRDLAVMGTVITSIHEISAVLPVMMEMSVGLANGEVGLIMLEEKGASAICPAAPSPCTRTGWTSRVIATNPARR